MYGIPMTFGKKYKWKVIVESYTLTGNVYELVLGCAIRADNFNKDHGIVYLRDFNQGIGWNVGLWERRVGCEHVEVVESPKVEIRSERVPFSFSFLFDFTIENASKLHIFYNDNKIADVMGSFGRDSVVYPVVSMCATKTVRVVPWIGDVVSSDI